MNQDFRNYRVNFTKLNYILNKLKFKFTNIRNIPY
jgi:hypothetical protein